METSIERFIGVEEEDAQKLINGETVAAPDGVPVTLGDSDLLLVPVRSEESGSKSYKHTIRFTCNETGTEIPALVTVILSPSNSALSQDEILSNQQYLKSLVWTAESAFTAPYFIISIGEFIGIYSNNGLFEISDYLFEDIAID